MVGKVAWKFHISNGNDTTIFNFLRTDVKRKRDSPNANSPKEHLLIDAEVMNEGHSGNELVKSVQVERGGERQVLVYSISRWRRSIGEK